MATKLLDEMGLTERNRQNFRLRPDGKELLLILQYSNQPYSNVLELVAEYWENVGLKVLIKKTDMGLLGELDNQPDHEIIVRGGHAAAEIGNYINNAEFWDLKGSDFGTGVAWDNWMDAHDAIERGDKTLADYGGKMPGEEPPEDMQQVHRWILERSQVPFGSREYMELSERIFDTHAEKLFMIGTVGMVPWLYIAKNNMGNIPNTLKGMVTHPLQINWFAEQLYFKTPK